MMPHHSDDAQPPRAALEGLYALPAAGGLAWLPREIPGACWQCRHCRRVYRATTRVSARRRVSGGCDGPPRG